MGVFIQVDYTDTEGTAYKIEIADASYSGTINQIGGYAVLEYPKIKTMDILRGSALNIQLEADTSSDYYLRLIETVGDKKLPVSFYRGGTLIWTGFIKPDGITESFVTDFWYINVQAVDGLGFLGNTKFLNSDNEVYQGSYSELELLTRCLQLTGQSLNFNIYDFNLYFSTEGDDPELTNRALFHTYVNTDRYVKKDEQESVFTVKDVLEALLKKYGAFICQQDNEWHIIRLIDYFTTETSVQKSLYDSDGVYQSVSTPDHRKTLGSDIDDYDPCHAEGNQRKTYNAALGAYKVFYEYGFVASLFENSKIYFDDGIGTIDGWTVADTSFFTFSEQDAIPGYPSGYYIGKFISKQRVASPLNTTITALTSDSSPIASVESGDSLKINLKGSITQRNYGISMFMEIKLTGDSGTEYYLNTNGEWTLSQAYVKIMQNYIAIDQAPVSTDFTTEITSNSTAEAGEVTAIFMRPTWTDTSLRGQDTVTINYFGLTGQDLGIKGESHTANRIENTSAVVDSEDNVYVGDNDGEIYIGAIEDVNGENSQLWSKEDAAVLDLSKQFPVLNWLVRDRLTISSGNSTVFSGGIYGYLPYLGVLSINNVTGIFMTTEYRWDTLRNTIEAEHQRIFTDDIYSQVTVDFNLESDNVVRPAIE